MRWCTAGGRKNRTMQYDGDRKAVYNMLAGLLEDASAEQDSRSLRLGFVGSSIAVASGSDMHRTGQVDFPGWLARVVGLADMPPTVGVPTLEGSRRSRPVTPGGLSRRVGTPRQARPRHLQAVGVAPRLLSRQVRCSQGARPSSRPRTSARRTSSLLGTACAAMPRGSSTSWRHERPSSMLMWSTWRLTAQCWAAGR